MKQYTKIVLLVIFALFLSLTACQRPASRAPVASPTVEGEVPFPFDTEDPFSAIRTQTAIAQNPPADQPTATPDVQIATETEPSGEAAPEEAAVQATNTPAPQAQAQEEPVNIPEVTRPETYALQKGEWPICIARRYNLDLSSFFALNGLNMNSKPGVGTVLRIPSSGTWGANYGSRALRSHPENYTVSGGDTIYTIACRYGDVAPEQILAANNLSSASEIQSGMQLRIP